MYSKEGGEAKQPEKKLHDKAEIERKLGSNAFSCLS